MDIADISDRNVVTECAASKISLGFGACTVGKLVPITVSQGIWQLPPGHLTENFR
jgi:hypothetical protein